MRGMQGCLDQDFFNCSSPGTAPTVDATSLSLQYGGQGIKCPNSIGLLSRGRRGCATVTRPAVVSRDTGSILSKLLRAFGVHQLLVVRVSNCCS